MQVFRNLRVWEKAHALTLDAYRCSKAFPREEIYGLTSQVRRASVWIGATIAEGSCQGGDADFARFLQMAAASASELEYELILAHDLQVVKAADHERLPAHTIEVKRMLAALIRTPRAES